MLPYPLRMGIGVFPVESVGQVDKTEALLEVHLVESFNAVQMVLEGILEKIWKDRDAIFVPFAIANEKGLLFKIEILDPQTKAFHEPQPASVEQLCNQAMGVEQAIEDQVDFFFGEDGGQAFGFFGAQGVDGFVHGTTEDFTVEKEQCAEGLVLGGGSHICRNS